MINFDIFRILTDHGVIDPFSFRQAIDKEQSRIGWAYPALVAWTDQAIARAQLPAALEAEEKARKAHLAAQVELGNAKVAVTGAQQQLTVATTQLEEQQAALTAAVVSLQAARNALQDAQLDKGDTGAAETLVNQWRQEVARLQEVVTAADNQQATLQAELTAINAQFAEREESARLATFHYEKRQADVRRLQQEQPLPIDYQQLNTLKAKITWAEEQLMAFEKGQLAKMSGADSLQYQELQEQVQKAKQEYLEKSNVPLQKQQEQPLPIDAAA